MGGFEKHMGLFDIFSKSESKKQDEEKKDDNLIVSDFVKLESQENDEEKKSEEIFENKQKNPSETDDETLTSYHDSLETQKPVKQKKHATRESYKDQNIWRDVESIEEKVDNLHVDRAVRKRSDLDKKVDGILKRKK